MLIIKKYENIKDRFVSLYKLLHHTHEQNFKARLFSDGASVGMEVDFYGRGTNPPHALHSEGHQDSMGICLYLALTQELNENLVELIILDDVMISVDTHHRKTFCLLLNSEFPDYQFLITTHDKNWAYQLKTEAVVTSKSLVELFNWNIDTGPFINHRVDIWDRIRRDLENNDVSSAAARLRRGSEQFFSIICENFRATITFKFNAQWDLGELLPAAVNKYRKLVDKAIKSAQSWTDNEKENELKGIYKNFTKTLQRSNAERWGINPNVHYQMWANFSVYDFKPIVEAFKQLFNEFICQKCTSTYFITTLKMEETALRCKCSHINWNLVKKKESN